MRSISSRCGCVFDTFEQRQMLSVVSFDTAGHYGTDTVMAPAAVAGLTVTPLTRASSGTQRFQPASWSANLNSFSSSPLGNYATTAAAAITAGQYYEFKITPDAGKVLALSTFTLLPSMQNDSGSYCEQVQVADTDLSTPGDQPSAWYSTPNNLAPASPTAQPPLTTFIPGAGGLSSIRSQVTVRIVIFGGRTWDANTFWPLAGNTPEIAVGGSVTDAIPTAPSNLDANSLQKGLGVSLSWTDNATFETGYSIQRDVSQSFSSPTTFNLSANATSYTDNSVSAGVTYYYRVVAKNGAATSLWSNGKGLTPFHVYETGWAMGTQNPSTPSEQFSANSMMIGDTSWNNPPGRAIGAFAQAVPGHDDGKPDFDHFADTNIANAVGIAYDAASLAGETSFWIFDDMEFNNGSGGHDVNVLHETLDAKIRSATQALNDSHSTNITVYIGDYSFDAYGANDPAVAAALTALKPYRISPGVYADAAAPPLYIVTPNSYQDELTKRQAGMQWLKDNGVMSVPFVNLKDETGVIINSARMDAIVAMIHAAGNVLTRWNPEYESTSPGFDASYLAAQATFIDKLQAKFDF